MLLKLRAPPGPARSEITQLADIFRASIVDVGEATFTLCVTGDPGKVWTRYEPCRLMLRLIDVQMRKHNRS